MDLFNTKKLLELTGLFWQYPVKTEEEFYKQNINNPNFCGIPWATIIDKKINTKSLLQIILQFIHHKNYYTCCQHIHFRKLLPLMKIIGITTVYTPHKIIDEDEINGIKLMPCPLYAVNFEDENRNKIFKNVDLLTINRKYLYSFMGDFNQII